MEKTCVNHPNDFHVTKDKYCFRCGAALIERKQCECDRDIQLFYAYCPRCGKKIDWEKKND
jgi:predicted amidophosphoribosyltransferase